MLASCGGNVVTEVPTTTDGGTVDGETPIDGAPEIDGTIANPSSDAQGADAAVVGDSRDEGSDGPPECAGPDCTPRSCEHIGPGLSNCGASGESCCTSLAVPGGTFLRDYDGVSYTNQAYPAKVSAFRLDKYEITVGRFRQFVNALVAGWAPDAGAGKHTHLNAGNGLNGGTEQGWDPFWPSNLPRQPEASGLLCSQVYPTWTAAAGPNENLPINCETWYEAYAFCIWDGGFLPTEAEWNYAAAAGSEQRVYPWSTPAASGMIDSTYANYDCFTRLSCILAVGSDPLGAGKWGQLDLAGNMAEWTLDTYQSPYAPLDCSDCAFTDHPLGYRTAVRGGGFSSNAANLMVSIRRPVPLGRGYNEGARCARAP
jgi:formylglycine-generating enzyme required for sulfatase activity